MSGDDSDSTLIEVAPAADFEPEQPEFATVGELEVGVFRVDDEYYAVANVCAHEAGPVCTGRVGRELVAEYVGPGEPVRESYAETPTIACPWHGWEYDLTTGRHLGDDDIAIPTFEVEVRDGVVHVVAE